MSRLCLLRCAAGSRSAPSDRAAHLSLALQPYHGLSNIGVLMGEQLASSGAVVDYKILQASVHSFIQSKLCAQHPVLCDSLTSLFLHSIC